MQNRKIVSPYPLLEKSGNLQNSPSVAQAPGAVSPWQTKFGSFSGRFCPMFPCHSIIFIFVMRNQLKKIPQVLGWSRICLPSSLNARHALVNHLVHESENAHDIICRFSSQICCQVPCGIKSGKYNLDYIIQQNERIVCSTIWCHLCAGQIVLPPSPPRAAPGSEKIWVW